MMKYLLFIFEDMTMKEELYREVTEDELQSIADGELDILTYDRGFKRMCEDGEWVSA